MIRNWLIINEKSDINFNKDKENKIKTPSLSKRNVKSQSEIQFYNAETNKKPSPILIIDLHKQIMRVS